MSETEDLERRLRIARAMLAANEKMLAQAELKSKLQPRTKKKGETGTGTLHGNLSYNRYAWQQKAIECRVNIERYTAEIEELKEVLGIL